LTDALNKQVNFSYLIAYGQFHRGHLNVVETICLATLRAFEMYMIMMMLIMGTVVGAKGILKTATIIKYFMYQSPIKKSL
jgi:hypothetical protein